MIRESGRLRGFRNQLVVGLAALVLAAVATTPKKANPYETGDMSNPPASLSIHPLLVPELKDFHSPEGVEFRLVEVQRGSINEDSPDDLYIRAFNHFTPALPGYPSSIEWALNPELQADYPFGDHSWPRVVEDYREGFIGENFGFVKHVIDDLTSPAHVHRDIHPIYDSYESWTNQYKKELFSNSLLHPEEIPRFNSLEELMASLGNFTRANFPSDDAWGNSLEGLYKADYGNKQYWVRDLNGKSVRVLKRNFFLNFRDDNCFIDQWSVLGTKAIEYAASALDLLVAENPTSTPDAGSSCSPHYSRACYGSSSYFENSCGEREELIEICGTEEICQDGECSGGSCVDQCFDGAKQCQSNSWRECGDYNSDGCVEWSSTTACSGTCLEGICQGSDVCSTTENCPDQSCVLYDNFDGNGIGRCRWYGPRCLDNNVSNSYLTLNNSCPDILTKPDTLCPADYTVEIRERLNSSGNGFFISLSDPSNHRISLFTYPSPPDSILLTVGENDYSSPSIVTSIPGVSDTTLTIQKQGNNVRLYINGTSTGTATYGSGGLENIYLTRQGTEWLVDEVKINCN